jgi:hypothetical protein
MRFCWASLVAGSRQVVAPVRDGSAGEGAMGLLQLSQASQGDVGIPAGWWRVPGVRGKQRLSRQAAYQPER